MSEVKIGKTQLATLVVVFFLGMQIVSYFFLNRTLFDLSFIVLGTIVFISQVDYIFSKYLSLFLIICLVSLLGLYITFVEHKIGSMAPLRLLMHFAFLTLMIRYDISRTAIKSILYTYIGYVFVLLLLFHIPLRNILPAASENFVGWVALALGITYYVLCYRDRQKLEAYTAYIILIFAIVCVGRSTILGALMLLFGVYYEKIISLSLKIKLVVIPLCVLLLLAVFLNLSSIISTLPFMGKFQSKGVNLDGRDMMIVAYYDKLNLKTFFVGVTPRQYPFTLLHENLHNSFLAVHSQFGFAGFGFLVFLVFTFIFRFFHAPFLIILLLAMCVRSFTDTISFIGIFDFIIFYILYLLWRDKQMNVYQAKYNLHKSL